MLQVRKLCRYVVEVNGSVGILVLVGKVALLKFDYSLHLRVVEVELKLWMVTIIVCHFLSYFGS